MTWKLRTIDGVFAVHVGEAPPATAEGRRLVALDRSERIAWYGRGQRS